MKKSILVILGLLLTSPAWGAKGMGFSYIPSFLYSSTSSKQGATSTSSSNLALDHKIGYTLSSSWYFGAIMSDDGADTSKNTATGVSFGYMGANWWSMFHYFISVDNDGATSATTDDFSGSSGMGLDVGYLMHINSWFSFGPQLRYVSYTYDKFNGGAIPGGNITTTDIRPFITLAFNF